MIFLIQMNKLQMLHVLASLNFCQKALQDMEKKCLPRSYSASAREREKGVAHAKAMMVSLGIMFVNIRLDAFCS